MYLEALEGRHLLNNQHHNNNNNNRNNGLKPAERWALEQLSHLNLLLTFV
jgi:hypothetical protein